MQNIDPLLFLLPVLAIATSLGPIIYWWYRRGLRGIILPLSFGAYFLAIGAKEAIQIPTIGLVVARFGQTSIGLGLYYGLQTVFLEVGLAYLFARFAVKRWGLSAKDAVPYGLSLAFWENGVLLGALSILNYGVLYLLLSGGTSTAATTYSQLVAAEPSLFLAPATLLPLELIGTLERISSQLVHVAFGVLCVYSAVSGKKKYLAYALPMGLVDALVPFASLNTNLFEAGIFVLSLLFLSVAWKASKGIVPNQVPSPVGA